MSKTKKRRMTIVITITIISLVLTIAWIIPAVRVDLNGFAYGDEISHAADLGHSIGAEGDAIQAERLAMQQSANPFLRLAANTTYLVRVVISVILITFSWFGVKTTKLWIEYWFEKAYRKER